MASKVPQTVTLAEFLEWDDGTDRRYQLVDGVPVMMAPTLEAHGELALNIGAEIRSRLQSPCRVIAEAGVTVPARRDTFYVADLAITCAPREPGRRMLAEPVVIVEVLSPSIGPVDRWRKVADCRTLPSVEAIVVAFAEERRIELQRRTTEGWRVEDLIGQAELALPRCATPIPLDALYPNLPGPQHEIGLEG
ncbi:MAG TPA: Uma2 family endonuclease [Geminicoccaceae bacterium]|nr:Uma2 family endonuclease [Geminicoccaceae bacterium]